MKKILFLFFGLSYMGSAIAAEYDIYGMQLGMTEDEIKPIIKKVLDVDDTAFKKKDNILTAIKGERQIVVDFVPFPLSGSPKKQGAGKILYRLPATAENAKSLKDEMTEKYGNSVSNTSEAWCKEPVKDYGAIKCDAYDGEVLRVDAFGYAQIILKGPEFERNF